MTDNATTRRAADCAQREGDHQRWVDDGGPSPAEAPSARWQLLTWQQDTQALWRAACAALTAPHAMGVT